MLRFKELRLQNFRPYKGFQEITFPDGRGVVAIYGNNMRGKTSLLEAFRWALYGESLGRQGEEVDFTNLCNWEAAKEGEYKFGVTLLFEHGGREFELRRYGIPVTDGEMPESSGDYEVNTTLEVDGAVVGPDERERLLAEVMPKEVSRFFLFDGELLREYAELLSDESDMGRKIKESIERILGVPVLRRCKAHLDHLSTEAEKEVAGKAQERENTQQMGAHLEQLAELKSEQSRELQELRDDLSDRQRERNRLEEQLEKHDRLAGLAQEKRQKEGDIEKWRNELDEKREELQDLMGDSWLAVLAKPIREIRRSRQDRLAELTDQLTEVVRDEVYSEIASDSLDEEKCVVCGRAVDEDCEDHIREVVDRASGSGNGSRSEIEEEIAELRQSVGMLEEFGPRMRPEKILSLKSAIEDRQAQIISAQARIDEIEDEFGGGTTIGDIEKLQRRYRAVGEEIGELKTGVEEQLEAVEDLEEDIAELRQRLDEQAGDDLEEVRRKRDIYEQIHRLFSDAFEEFRDRLKGRVEEDASSLFLNLTAEPEYESLRINDNYGLTIIHEDGDPIPLRSAGAEQVVALSLVGALQKNAPLRGPVIMDSSFTRLDPDHTRNTIQHLTDISDQAVLLVFESEIPKDFVRRKLGGALVAEYEMRRVSARHTELESL